VADDEHRPLRAPGEVAEGLRVAARGVVEALAAGEVIVARVLLLPGAVAVERPALELADVDVVEPRLLQLRDPVEPIAEGEPRRLDRAREPRVHAEVPVVVGDHQPERSRLDAAVLAQRDRHRRVAVDSVLDVVRRVAVAREDEEGHRSELRLRDPG
jgi:hypothetical protein